MDWIVTLVQAQIAKMTMTEFILFAVVILQGVFFFKYRHEEREDKRALIAAMDRNTEALSKLQLVVAAVSGKAPV
jgi:hypothetical protein